MIFKAFKDNDFRKRFIKENLFDERGKVLDLGAGEKPYKHLFNPKQYESTDIMGEQTYICDSEKIPVSDQYYDAIICTQVFEHIPHPWITIKEMNRILKKGGKVIITVPQSEEMHGTFPHNYYQYTKFGLELLLKENGFTLIKIEAMSKWFSFNAEQFRKACRYNPHIGIILWPFSEFIFPLTCIILDLFEFTGKQGDGWALFAQKKDHIDIRIGS